MEEFKLFRKAEKELLDWKNNRNTALLVTGARQIGKTYLINSFIDKNFNNVVRIDFSQERDLLDSFSKRRNLEEFNRLLTLIAKDKLIENETVFFFDEIQELYKHRKLLKEKGEIDDTYVDLITLMKPLSIEKKYRFILSGSLLGVTLNDIDLYPLGYMDEIRMYPLDFEEFLINKKVDNTIIDYLKECFINKNEVDQAINERILSYFKEYVLIGGMPEVVSSYLSNNNLYLLETIYKNISSKYHKDIKIYIEDNEKKLRVDAIYNSLGSELNNKNKRFISTHVIERKYLKEKNITDEFLWLTNAGIALPIYNVSEPTIPLKISENRKTLKLFNSDVGLLIYSLIDTKIRENLMNNEININYGAPYENVIAMELYAHGFNEKTYYYNDKRNGEVDFLIEKNAEVLPLEIKSGKPNEMNYYNHSALNNLIKTYSYKEAYVLGNTNIKKETDIIYQLPIYMIMFIKK